MSVRRERLPRNRSLVQVRPVGADSSQDGVSAAWLRSAPQRGSETPRGCLLELMKDRRINGQALENIMRDVLGGVQDLTCDVSASSVQGEMRVLSVEKPACQQKPVARIIPFPTRK